MIKKLEFSAFLLLFSGLLMISAIPTKQENSSELLATADGYAEPIKILLLGQSLIRNSPTGYREKPLESLLPVLKSADVVFTNLEVTIDDRFRNLAPTKKPSSMQIGQPEVVDFLASINVNLISLVNNHAWNFGADGMLNI